MLPPVAECAGFLMKKDGARKKMLPLSLCPKLSMNRNRAHLKEGDYRVHSIVGSASDTHSKETADDSLFFVRKQELFTKP